MAKKTKRVKRKRRIKKLHPAEKYIEDVLSDKILACKWVKLACQRQVDDLKRGHRRGLFFDEEAAKHAIGFYSFVRHSKGEWAGQIFEPEPWQQFIKWCVFGWKIKKTGYRRFKTVYEEVPRKNGKTTDLAATGLYLLDADSEPGAEIYSVSTKRDQSRISHAEATRMVSSSPDLRRHIDIFRDNISIQKTGSKYEPLGADADTMDGLNIHGGLIDELHAHKNRKVWDIIDTATGSRRQPLIWAITTAGFDRHSICWEQHQHTEKILELKNDFKDDSFFGIIYTLDEGDDYADKKVWIKANPNLGISVNVDDLKQKVNKAKQTPSFENAVKRLKFNIWTESITKWINLESWKACGFPVDVEELRGRHCYVALDLSSNIDITACALIFPPKVENEKYKLLCRFFIPEDNVQGRVKRDRVPYDVWIKQKHIIATPGNIIDYDFILKQIEKDLSLYDIRELAFDRWGSQKITTDLQKIGFEIDGKKNLIQFGQGFASMAAPTKEFEKMILSKEIAHGNNPVLTWMVSNTVVKQDPAGNMKVDKEKSIEKVDGVVATIMALSRTMVNKGEPKCSASSVMVF